MMRRFLEFPLTDKGSGLRDSALTSSSQGVYFGRRMTLLSTQCIGSAVRPGWAVPVFDVPTVRRFISEHYSLLMGSSSEDYRWRAFWWLRMMGRSAT
jgi:hypothetical protein